MNDVSSTVENINSDTPPSEDPPQRTHTKSTHSKLIVSDRTACRLIAVQALYSLEIAKKRPSEAIRDLDIFRQTVLENLNIKKKNIIFPKNIDYDYTASIIRGVVREQRVIDPVISDTLADGWKFSRLDKVLVAILRAAIYELLFSPDIPPKVTINEYTNIASSFELTHNNALVNGILNAIARANNLI